MENFAKKLNAEVQTYLYEIRTSNADNQQKACDSFLFLRKIISRLKEFTIGYEFDRREREIGFFKSTKPRLMFQLIYNYDVYMMELGRPVGSDEAVLNYLDSELAGIDAFFVHNSDFIRYYRSGATYLDEQYFLRGTQLDTDRICFNCDYYDFDPRFTTGGDILIARIMASELYSDYIREQLRRLVSRDGEDTLPETDLSWTGRKSELIERLYAWDADGCFNNGKLPMTKLTSQIERVFNIKLDNSPQSFNEMRYRNVPTPFLDRLKARLLERMGRKK